MFQKFSLNLSGFQISKLHQQASCLEFFGKFLLGMATFVCIDSQKFSYD